MATKDAELGTDFKFENFENKEIKKQRKKNISALSSLEKEVAIAVGIVGELNSRQQTTAGHEGM